MSQAVKWMKIPINSTVIQPAACFQLSDQTCLEQCHECWRVGNDRGNLGKLLYFQILGFHKCFFQNSKKNRKLNLRKWLKVKKNINF
jgi:hypothetical protein